MWCALTDNLSAVVMTVFSLRAMLWTLQTVAIALVLLEMWTSLTTPSHMFHLLSLLFLLYIMLCVYNDVGILIRSLPKTTISNSLTSCGVK